MIDWAAKFHQGIINDPRGINFSFLFLKERMSGNVMENKLTTKQLEAIPVILSSPSLEEAARKLGINVRTLYRWKDQPDFQSALAEAERSIYQNNIKKVISLQSAAIDCLAEFLTNTEQNKASIRLRAARELIDLADHYHEINRNESISSLEAILYELRKKIKKT
ncbi:MAG: hypothetical protein AB9897_06005 [Anaerolineaceae bacterium]